ncbi:hypothetical protein M970_100560 [Encephalitozoon cuniculi EcunIII-L]|nr:hypothetical protein M970_100560 [Encephalitozoon cuniculi EcunIII-L]
MDVQALRKERETHIKERDVLVDEMDSFIASHIGEIREALTACEPVVDKISREDLLAFVSCRISRLVSLAREKKIEMFSRLAEKEIDCECLDGLLAAEYCYGRVLGDGSKELSTLDTDVYFDINSGEIDIKSNGVQRVAVGADERLCEPLDRLFSEKFHARINGRMMWSYILGVKLEMGLEILQGLYGNSEEDLVKLTSYKHYREKGLPVLISNDDMARGLLEDVKARVEEEVNKIVGMGFSDRGKASLVNYLLVMFSGVASDVDLSYFDGKKESYILDWRRLRSDGFIQSTDAG